MEHPKPFLRWAGSKRRILPTLVQYVPERYRSYVEPFMGSACLFFAVNPASAVLADINADLVSTYRTVRKCPRVLAAALAKIPASKPHYEAYRKVCSSTLDSFNSALRFIFLNRLCFNGVYRTNREGLFNVPMGTRLGSIPDAEHLASCARALRSKTLLHA